MSGGGGSGSTNSNTTVTNQSIPKEFFPYFHRVLTKGEALSNEDYIPYGGQRLADTSGDTQGAYGMIRGIAANGMPMTAAGANYAGNLVGQAGQAGAGGPYQFSQYDYSGPGTFTGQAVGQYMSPYMQQVVDAQKRSALEDFQMANQARNAQAIQAGAFGGSRAAVQQSLAERDLLSRTNQIQAEGLQKSYEDAQRMFEQDRAARMAVDQARAAELNRVQAGQAGENQAYANLTLDKARVQSGLLDQMSTLEQRARSGDIQAAQLLEAVGKAQQSQQQAGLDMAYQDFLRQLNYPMDRLTQYASLLHGSPLANATQTTQTTQTPYNPIQQALGMGISALGLYNAMV